MNYPEKKVLLITSFSPLKSKDGDSVVVMGVIRALEFLGLKVDVLCFSENIRKKKTKNIKKINLTELSWNHTKKNFFQKMILLFSVKPFFIKKMENSGFSDEIKNKLKKTNYKAVIVHGYQMAPYVKFVSQKIKKIFLENENMQNIFFTRLVDEKNIFKKLFYFNEYVKSIFYQNFSFSVFSKYQEAWLLNKKK